MARTRKNASVNQNTSTADTTAQEQENTMNEQNTQITDDIAAQFLASDTVTEPQSAQPPAEESGFPTEPPADEIYEDEEDPFADPEPQAPAGTPAKAMPVATNKVQMVSSHQTTSSSGYQPNWNGLVTRAAAGDINARKLLDEQMYQRWDTAFQQTRNNPQFANVAKISLVLKQMQKQVSMLVRRHLQAAQWDLSELMEMPVFTQQIHERFTEMALVQICSGKRGRNPGDRWIRGLQNIEFSSYGQVEAGPTSFLIHIDGQTIAVSAETLHQIFLDAIPETIQAAPYTFQAVMYRAGSASQAYDGYTLVYPQGAGFEDISGELHSFKSPIRLSMEYQTFAWLYWPIEFALGNWDTENQAEHDRISNMAEALKYCFETEQGLALPANKDQLDWLQAIYVHMLRGNELFEQGRMLAGMNVQILGNFDAFITHWHKLQARRNQARMERAQQRQQQRGGGRSAQPTQAPATPRVTLTLDDPLASLD